MNFQEGTNDLEFAAAVFTKFFFCFLKLLLIQQLSERPDLKGSLGMLR